MSILVTVADFVTAISGLAADKVIIARENYLESNFNDNIAVVDSLISTPLGRNNDYDGEEEELTYRVYFKSQMTIDFYGTNALTNANKFIARLNSQQAHEFKRDNNIEVFHNKTITNIKKLQGKTTYDRFQIEIMVKYSEEFTDDVLRIDTAEFEINTNN